MTLAVDVILVPAGLEHFSVTAAMSSGFPNRPTVAPIPIGPAAQRAHLERMLVAGLFPQGSRILLMGLGGALVEGLAVGEGLLVEDCGRQSDDSGVVWRECDPALIATIARTVPGIRSGRLITADAVVFRSRDKKLLGLKTHADMVDMEGFPVLAILSAAGHRVAILRVVSDGCDHDIPDFQGVLSSEGSLQAFPLLLRFLKRPKEAIRLISGSLKALRALNLLTHQLFSGDPSSLA